MSPMPPDRLSDPEDLTYDHAAHIVAAEREHLAAWRGRPPRVGLALSGGGIRSASFSLGVLQALAHAGALPNVDILSTVSGGGYIGGSLSYLLHDARRRAAREAEAEFDVSKAHFPYVSYPMVSVDAPAPQAGPRERLKGQLLRRLRQNASYLAPGQGITMVSLAGVVLRNVLAGILVHGALLLAGMALLWQAGVLPAAAWTAAGHGGASLPETGLLRAALALFALYLLLSLLFMLATRVLHRLAGRPGWQQAPYALRRACETWTGRLLAAALACLVLGLVPATYATLQGWQLASPSRWLDILGGLAGGSKPAATGVLATLLGVAGNLLGFAQSRGGRRPRIPTGVLVAVASALLLFGVLLLSYALTARLQAEGLGTAEILAAAAAVLLLVGLLPLANFVSLHRYYRDRLLELFMPDVPALARALATGSQGAAGGPSRPGDTAMLGDLCQPAPGARPEDAPRDLRLRGPYPILNANVVLVSSRHPRYRGRGGDNFILSPLFYGSRATGWAASERARDRGFSLATAMAISGAALNPNAAPGGEGPTRQPVLSVLMGMLNLRLGYWAENPGTYGAAAATRRPAEANMLWPGLKESFGRRNLHEHERFVLLTDGGHFENLGLYELVRRRLRLIVVCDATRDGDYGFADLANAIEKVRADFGAIVGVSGADLAALAPRPRERGRDDTRPPVAERAYLVAPITYARRSGQWPDHASDPGVLVLLKASFFEGLSADLHGYRRAHPGFPNQSTGDQFFDERQFEAYRELGFQTAWAMLNRLREAGGTHPDPLYGEARSLLME